MAKQPEKKPDVEKKPDLKTDSKGNVVSKGGRPKKKRGTSDGSMAC